MKEGQVDKREAELVRAIQTFKEPARSFWNVGQIWCLNKS